MIVLNGISYSTCWIDCGWVSSIIDWWRHSFHGISTRFNVNGILFDPILLQQSIQKGFSLSPHLYVIATHVLGYLLDAAIVKGKIRGISLLGGNQLLKDHFVDDLL
jgi:hypothetical protein